jgi:hypothetical protein
MPLLLDPAPPARENETGEKEVANILKFSEEHEEIKERLSLTEELVSSVLQGSKEVAELAELFFKTRDQIKVIGRII